MNGRCKSGPSFLKKGKHEWSRKSADPIGDDPERKKTKVIAAGSVDPIGDDPERKKTKVIAAGSLRTPLLDSSAHSSWKRLTRITAYISAFCPQHES